MLVRITNMRGVNLNVFDFDYDLTWAAFFMNASEKIYGRFGGRDAGPADAHLTLPGLKYTMRAALDSYRHDPNGAPGGGAKEVLTVEQYPSARRVKEGGCIHCHMVYGFRRDAAKAAGRWRRELTWEWLYPLPENVGLTLDVNQGDRVSAVAPDSAASRAGVRAGDLLKSLSGTPVASFADVEWALHRAPASGKIPIAWQQGGRTRRGELVLAEGWRKTDISWRSFMWGLDPTPGVMGQDLTAKEKEELGLPARRLAFRQGPYVTKEARAVGIQKGDVIIGIDDRPMEMTALQFNAYVRLNYNIGDHITLNVIRNGQRLNLPMALPDRDTF